MPLLDTHLDGVARPRTAWVASVLLLCVVTGGGSEVNAQDRPNARLQASPPEVAATSTADASAPVGPSTLHETVRYALLHNPEMRRQQWQIEGQRGALGSAAGVLDPQFVISASNNRSHQFLHEASASSGSLAFAKTTANTTTSRVGLQKPFGMGLTVEPFLQMERTQTLGAPTAPLVQTSLGVTAMYPLLRGRGADVVLANRRAARHRLDAEVLQRQFVASDVAYRTTRSYWEYVAARKLVVIFRESEERAETLLQETTMLVDRDEKPAADLEQLKADLAAKQAQRITAERALATSWQDLRIVMGAPADSILTPPLTTPPFPTAPATLDASLAVPDSFVATALHRRSDLAAARQRQVAADRLRDASANDRRPRIDVTLDVSYAGLGPSEGVQPYVSPFGHDVNGLNATLSIRSDLSLRNRTRVGNFRQQQARSRQQAITTNNLQREIDISVATTVHLLRGSVRQLRKSDDAVSLYRNIIQNEKKKYRMGIATLFDVIVAEERLTEALTTYVDNQNRYAELVARLRLQTHTILTFDRGQPIVAVDHLTTVPLVETPGRRPASD